VTAREGFFFVLLRLMPNYATNFFTTYVCMYNSPGYIWLLSHDWREPSPHYFSRTPSYLHMRTARSRDNSKTMIGRGMSRDWKFKMKSYMRLTVAVLRGKGHTWEFIASPSDKSLQLICICAYILGSSINVMLRGVGGFPTERDMVWRDRCSPQQVRYTVTCGTEQR
jgi:hypothetical protein